MNLRAHTRSSVVADTVERLSRALLETRGRLPIDPGEQEKFFESPWRRRPTRMRAGIGMLVPEVMWTGIYGVGVGGMDDKEFPVLIVDEELINSGVTEKLLAEIFDIKVPSDLQYLTTQEPEPEAHSCHCSDRIGTLGAAVLTQAHTRARLTAGHVANPVGAHIADEEGSFMGVVSFSQDPATAPAGRMSADVAVIEVPERHFTAEEQYKGPGYGMPGDSITMFGSSGTSSERLFCYAPWIAVPSISGFWAHVYLTQSAISQPGDSGAIVVLTESPDIPIGHVVGASRPATTYIQDLDFQLAVSGTQLV